MFSYIHHRKLQLARFKWTLFTDDSKSNDNLTKLVSTMKSHLVELSSEPGPEVAAPSAHDPHGSSQRKQYYFWNH